MKRTAVFLGMAAIAAVSASAAGTKVLTQMEEVTSNWSAYKTDTYITGAGGFRVMSGAQLIFNESATFTNDYSGGIIVEDGGHLWCRQYGVKGTPFGSGPIVLNCSGTNTCLCTMTKLTLSQMVTIAGNSSQAYPAFNLAYMAATFNDMTVNGDLWLDSEKGDDDKYYGLDYYNFNKAVNATGHDVGYSGHGICNFKKVLNCRELVGYYKAPTTCASTANGRLGGIELNSSNNGIGRIRLDSQFVRCLSDNALTGAVLRIEGQHPCHGPEGHESKVTGYLNLNANTSGAYTQTLGYIESDERERSSTAGYNVINSSADYATLVLNGAADTTADSWVSIDGKINLEFAASVPASFRQVFHVRESTMSGSMTVKGGTLALADCATFSNVTSVALSNAGRLEIAVGTQPFTDDAVDLSIRKGSELVLPSGYQLKVKTLTVRGETVAAGTYSSADFPEITGGGQVVSSQGGASAVKLSCWIGASGADWNVESNWEPEFLPGGDRVAFFNSAATVGGGPIEIGASGLVISNTAAVTIDAVLTGPGQLVKCATGELTLKKTSDYAGGTLVMDGDIYTQINHAFGTGLIEFRRTADHNPWFYPSGAIVTNDILISGAYVSGKYTIQPANGAKLTGHITAEDDFICRGRYQGAGVTDKFTGGISAHGHTVRFVCDLERSVRFVLEGEVDASILNANSMTEIRNYADFVDPEATYAVYTCTNTIYYGAEIACTNVIADNSVLCLYGPSLSRNAKLTVSNGGTLYLKDAAEVVVGYLEIEGVSVPNGVYGKADYPATIIGEGKIRVKKPGQDGLVALFTDNVPRKLLLAGDSTLDNHKGDESDYGSWGYLLRRYLKTGNQILDFAKSGYATRSFVADGYWDKLLAQTASNDFVIIQFGHNDQGNDSVKHNSTVPEYGTNLCQMIRDVRAKGAIPVICTPIVRCSSKDGKVAGYSLRDYADEAIASANKEGCDYVDMNAITRAEITEITPDIAENLYYRAYKDDRTHPNPNGARRFGDLFRYNVKTVNPLPIADLFR